jgi:hypothetical protein
MPESTQHFQLVQRIIRHVREEYRALAALALVDDCSKALFAERPPPIFGCVPDVFGIDTPHTITIIGEAKTDADLTTPRSKAQISAFYEYLSYQNRGRLILAVPQASAVSARTMLKKLSCFNACVAVRTTVLTG